MTTPSKTVRANRNEAVAAWVRDLINKHPDWAELEVRRKGQSWEARMPRWSISAYGETPADAESRIREFAVELAVELALSGAPIGL